MSVFTDRSGAEWQIDYDGCLVLLRIWAQAKARLNTTGVRRDSGGWEILTHDALAFRSERQRLFEQLCQGFDQRLLENPDRAVSFLVDRATETPRLEREFRRRRRSVIGSNMDRVANRVLATQVTIAGLQIAQAAAQVVAISMVTGGAGGLAAAASASEMAILGGGSAAIAVANGVGAYHSSGGNVGVAIATGGFSFVSTLLAVPVPGASMSYVLVVTSSALNATNAAVVDYASGGSQARTFTEALRREGANEAGGFLRGQALNLVSSVAPRLNAEMANALIPVIVSADVGTGVQSGVGRGLLPLRGAQARSMSDATAAGGAVEAMPQGMRNAGVQDIIGARQQARASEAAFQSTEFYQMIAHPDRRETMGWAERRVRGNLLRRA